MSTKSVHNAHIAERLPELHRALLEIVGEFNRPERDEQMLAASGLSLERALFPLLVSVARFGPIGVVELADRVGRDHTTVSRQVARLEDLGLLTRRPSASDRRVREALITVDGQAAVKKVDSAREGMAREIFAEWNKQDFDELCRLLRLLADGILDNKVLEQTANSAH